ncbi:MAG: hypothetical protein ACRYFR_05945 [Janthinobacterium lividum]
MNLVKKFCLGRKGTDFATECQAVASFFPEAVFLVETPEQVVYQLCPINADNHETGALLKAPNCRVSWLI